MQHHDSELTLQADLEKDMTTTYARPSPERDIEDDVATLEERPGQARAQGTGSDSSDIDKGDEKIVVAETSLEEPQPDTVPDVGPPPDGGRKAWSCAGSASLVTFCLMGFVCTFGQLQEYYLEHQLQGYAKSTVAWLGSLQACEVFIFSLIWGRFFDAYGATPLVITGTSLAVIASVGMAFCYKFWHFLLAHLLFGFASGMIWPTVTAVGGHWFSTRRGMAIGIIVGGSGVGSVVEPIMLRELFHRTSFRNALLALAGMNAVLMLPSWFLLKSRLPRRKPIAIRKLAHPWHDATYACFAVGASFYMFNWMSPMFNAPVIAKSNHTSQVIYDYSIAIMGVGSTFGRTLSGVLADKVGVWYTFGTTSFATAVILFAFYVGSPLGDAPVVIGFLLYGWVSGAWLTLVSAVVATISPVEEVGMRIGMAWSMCGPTMIVGPVVSGALITAADNRFTYAGIFCGFTFLISAVLSIGPRLVQVTMASLRRKEEAKPAEEA